MSKITILLSICAVFLVVCHGVPVCPDEGCPDNDLSSSSSSSAKQPLKNGFLLLGGSANLTTLNNVEAYGSDLILPSLPSLPISLYDHIAEMTESGAIYIAGGGSGGGRNDKTFMLSNLSSSKWMEVEARMPYPVDRAGSVVVGDIVLVLGGYISSLGSLHTNVFIQMLNTSKSLPTWKLLNQTLPEPIHWPSAAIFEGQVIIVTYDGVTYTTSVSSIISDTQLDWEESKLPGVAEGDVRGPSIEVVEDKLVAVWGSKVFTKTTMDSQWVQLKPLPQWKSGPSIGSVHGNIVIGGGAENFGVHRSSDTVFMWLEASSEWEKVTSLKIKRYNHATVQLPRGN